MLFCFINCGRKELLELDFVDCKRLICWLGVAGPFGFSGHLLLAVLAKARAHLSSAMSFLRRLCFISGGKSWVSFSLYYEQATWHRLCLYNYCLSPLRTGWWFIHLPMGNKHCWVFSSELCVVRVKEGSSEHESKLCWGVCHCVTLPSPLYCLCSVHCYRHNQILNLKIRISW